MNELEKYRRQIDKIDKSILKLIASRMKVVQNVGVYKKENGLKPLDTKRWKEVIESKVKLGKKLDIGEDLIKDIWKRIHEESLKIERSKIR